MCNRLVLTILMTISLFFDSMAQRKIESVEGYSPQIGVLVSMLDDLKERVEYHVIGLDQAEIDFLLDEKANRIGAIVMHLAATEVIYQRMTFEGWKYKNEYDEWATALSLGDDARRLFKDQPISYYMEKWDEVRAKTKTVLKTKDDAWLAQMMSDSSMNYHWAWFHVMEHHSNHMGQIALIKSRIKSTD